MHHIRPFPATCLWTFVTLVAFAFHGQWLSVLNILVVKATYQHSRWVGLVEKEQMLFQERIHVSERESPQGSERKKQQSALLEKYCGVPSTPGYWSGCSRNKMYLGTHQTQNIVEHWSFSKLETWHILVERHRHGP